MDTLLVKTYLEGLQTRIVDALTALDGKPFLRDAWTRAPSSGSGGGLTCILEEGNLFERAGVGFSHVFGPGLHGPEQVARAHGGLDGRPWAEAEDRWIYRAVKQ